MFLRNSSTSPVEVIEDVAKTREILSRWKGWILRPEYIFIASLEEGDVGMWNSWVTLLTLALGAQESALRGILTGTAINRVSSILLLTTCYHIVRDVS